MIAPDEIASEALRTGMPSAVTRPAAIAACARARLSNRPRATNRRSARSLAFMVSSSPAERSVAGEGDRAKGGGGGMQQRGSPRAEAPSTALTGGPPPPHCGGGCYLRELHHFAAHVLAERLEGLGDDAFGVETGLGVHGVGRVLIDEEIRQHHRADF